MRNKSAEKHERQDIIRRQRNRVLKSKVRTAYVNLLDAVSKTDKQEVENRFRIYISNIDKAIKKHVFHLNKGARLKSNITKKIKEILNQKQTA